MIYWDLFHLEVLEENIWIFYGKLVCVVATGWGSPYLYWESSKEPLLLVCIVSFIIEMQYLHGIWLQRGKEGELGCFKGFLRFIFHIIPWSPFIDYRRQTDSHLSLAHSSLIKVIVNLFFLFLFMSCKKKLFDQ